MSKYTPKTPKLTFKYGKLDGEYDFISSGGPGTQRADRNFLLCVFCFSQNCYDWQGKYTPNPTFLEELEKRGYDTKTIKFSIEKKK